MTRPTPADGWPAIFLDGASPAPRAARVVAGAQALEIRPESVQPLHWPVSAIEILESPDPARLRLSAGADARLEILGEEAAASVRALLEASTLRRAARGQATRRAAWIAGGVVALVVAAVLAWPWIADRLAHATPRAAEAALGEAVDRRLFAEVRRCERPAGRAALDQLVARLAPHADINGPLSVTVLDLPQVNAAAMPGGRIVIFRGLLRAAETPDEVAGVLAHELAHAAARHGLRGLYRGLGLSLLAGLVTGGSTLADAAVWFATMAHSRDFEREADARAAAMLVAAGIGTQGLITFFTRIEGERTEASGLLAYAASHPPSAERRAALVASVGRRPPLDHGQWQALRAICG